MDVVNSERNHRHLRVLRDVDSTGPLLFAEKYPRTRGFRFIKAILEGIES